MQVESSSTPNLERRAQMRAKLIAAARALFVEKGFAEASTPDIVKRAGVTRGALYHHFADKEALFRAVVEAEALAVRDAIDAIVPALEAEDALSLGSRAFFAAMAVEGRTRLLLVDGPAVLGIEAMDRIDAGGARAALRAGLAEAQPDRSAAELDALSVLLSAAFDRAAMTAKDQSDEERDLYQRVLEGLILKALR